MPDQPGGHKRNGVQSKHRSATRRFLVRVANRRMRRASRVDETFDGRHRHSALWNE